MNDRDLKAKVDSAMYNQCRTRGYAAPVDVLMDIGVLQKDRYEDWRHGRVPYLEKVCTVNLRKLSLIMHCMRSYAQSQGLKPSFCYYKQWGTSQKIPLRFSKSGDPKIERNYATHFVDKGRVAELKERRKGRLAPYPGAGWYQSMRFDRLADRAWNPVCRGSISRYESGHSSACGSVSSLLVRQISLFWMEDKVEDK